VDGQAKGNDRGDATAAAADTIRKP